MKNKYLGIIRIVQSILLRAISFIVRRDEKYVAFGSWVGERYVDNSKYLAEYICAHFPDINIVWVGKESIKAEVQKSIPGARVITPNRFRSNLLLLKCKYMFFSQMHGSDISQCNVYRGAILCYLHHGMPVKRWGADGIGYRDNRNRVQKWIDRVNGTSINYDYFVTSSALHDRTNCTALSYLGCTESKNLHTGTPRNDMLVNYDSAFSDKLRNEYCINRGLSKNTKIIVYLPTYRRVSENVFSFTRLSESQKERLNKILADNEAIIVEKSHFAEKILQNSNDNQYLIVEDKNINVQELLMFTDVLISDYSGAFLDYTLLDRPIIHYVYDYEYYKNVDSGLYYDISDFSAGDIAYTFDELILCLQRILDGTDLYRERRQTVREKYMGYEVGTASKQIVEKVMSL